MSRETVVWTTSKPCSRSASATSSCVESGRSWTSRRIAPRRSNLLTATPPPPPTRRPRTRGSSPPSGGARRPSTNGTGEKRTHVCRLRARSCAGNPQSSEAVLEHAEALRELLGRDRQRRRQADRPFAGGADEHAALERRVDDLHRGPLHVEREEQSAPARLGEGRAYLGLPRADAGEQLVGQLVDDRAGGGARHGIAAERARVVARRKPALRAVRDEQRPDRQTVREALGERDDVGLDAERLPCEERPRSSDAGLHLVEDEQRAELVGERPRGLDELRIGR